MESRRCTSRYKVQRQMWSQGLPSAVQNTVYFFMRVLDFSEIYRNWMQPKKNKQYWPYRSQSVPLSIVVVKKSLPKRGLGFSLFIPSSTSC